MILIADSGSTKTDWTVIKDDKTTELIQTKGINPFFQSKEEIATEIETSLLQHLPSKSFKGIYFYGAGCAFDKVEIVKEAIQVHLQADEVLVNSDMLAAAHALCGTNSGIACILGTGSNSCSYDGVEITANVSPLGFILGDEGSGAVLGKLFIGSLLKNQLKPGLKEEFLKEYNLTPGDIIDRVYRQPFPNRYLASLSPFIKKHIEEPSVHSLVLDSFKEFFKRNVMQYDYQKESVHFIGSIAYHYEDIIREAALEMGIKMGRTLKSPMKGLIEYHLTK